MGYQGVLGRRWFVNLTYYRSQLNDFTTNLLPQVGTSLGRLNPDFGAYVPPAELSPESTAIVLATLQAALPPGLYAAMSNTPNGDPAFVVVSLTNQGRVDTQGLEFGVQATLPGSLNLDLGYTFFDYEVREQAPEDPLVPNAPKHRLTTGLTYSGAALEAGFRLQWVDGFFWRSGLYAGEVPSYTVADLSSAYTIDPRWRVGLDIANVFDNKHFQMFGGSVLGRRALLHVTWNF